MRTVMCFVLNRFALAAACLVLSSASAQNLYFVTGTPTPKLNVAFDTQLYRLDAASGGITKVIDLVPSGDGTYFIESSLDHRVLVIASPYSRPSMLTVVSLDHPATPQTIPIGLPDNSLILQTPLLDLPDGGLIQSFVLLSRESQSPEFWGVSVNLQSGATLTRIPWKYLSYAVADGLVGDGGGGNQTVLVSASKEGELLNTTVGQHVESLRIHLPLKFGASASELMLLLVNTKNVAAFSRGFDHGNAIEAGTIYVLEKGRQQWGKVVSPGPLVWIRNLGGWLGGLSAEHSRDLIRSSPGKTRRQATLARPCAKAPPCAPISIDDLFEQSGTYFAGDLLLYNLQTARSYTIHTGQGDSEVLLVENDAVYYRVHNVVMKTEIGADGLGEPYPIASDAILAQAHWMFAAPK